ncbi:MAG TPA: ParB/RepB/Spo0J family partition protein, partial [Candidatus Saccharibacteria bacterium]|nr:ParB/RepB/Spo0J family partition protein [Candidatus Saccharibacteria bacterium]
ALAELAESIKTHGVLQPIIVVSKGGRYEIVAGERRYRAAKMAGLKTIPALIRSLSDQNKLELSLIENIQRQDLNAIETATAYQKLRVQFNLSLDEISKRVGNKSVSAISNTMRLLKLPKFVQEAIANGELTEGQARPFVGHDEDLIRSIVPRVIAEEWSARKIEQFIVNARSGQQEVTKTALSDVEKKHEAHIESLRKRLNAPVAIRVNSRGAGQIMIKFKNQNELERLQKLLGE